MTTTVRVLIVDDQPQFRQAATAVVRATPGFSVEGTAESGEAAVAMVDGETPVMVLMDINMPGIGGIEATRRIVAAAPSARVVLLSTYSLDDLPAETCCCGAVAYVHKEEFGPAVLRSVWDGEPDAGWTALEPSPG